MIPKHLRRWHEHVKAIQKKYPGKSLKEVLKIAKKSYKRKIKHTSRGWKQDRKLVSQQSWEISYRKRKRKKKSKRC